jgi:hypothetical protein
MNKEIFNTAYPNAVNLNLIVASNPYFFTYNFDFAINIFLIQENGIEN